MSSLIRSRLAHKVAIATSALALFAMAAMGMVAYAVAAAHVGVQAQAVLESQAAGRAERLSDIFEDITDGVRAVAGSGLALDALADARVRESYLVPQLSSLAKGHDVPIVVALIDNLGRLLAVSDARQVVGVDQWVAGLIGGGASGSRLTMDRDGAAITVVEPVAVSNGARARGALVYRITLRDLAGQMAPLAEAGALVLGDGRVRHAADFSQRLGPEHEFVVESPVRLPPVMNGLAASVRLGATPTAVDGALGRVIFTLVMAFLGIGVTVAVLGVVLGRRLTHRLVRLSTVAEDFIASGARVEFQSDGEDEVAHLGAALAGLVERLDHVHQDLERRNQTLLSNAERVAQVGSAVWHIGSGRHLWSDQFHAILGLDPGDALPGLSTFFDRVHPDDRARLSAALDAVVAEDRRLTEDFRVVRADGQERVTQLRAQLARNEAGDPARVDLTLQDITERKRMEERLDTLVGELRRSNEELEQFAYVASHDLRQPLRVVGSYVTLIEEMLENKLDAETGEFMDFIREGVRRMDMLITDLLAYSRVGRTSRDGPVDTGRALDLALIDLQVAIDDAKAKITHPAKMPVVLGDTSEMARLFQNLVGNGVKYRASDRAPVVEIGCSDAGAFWEFFVRDNGIGIPPEHVDRVFGIFQRLHARDEYEGTGIGLAICKKVVERQGGKIWIESATGAGVTFRFTCPKLRRVMDAAQ